MVHLEVHPFKSAPTMNYKTRNEYHLTEFVLAGIRKRLAAFLLDWLVLIAIYLSIIIVFALFDMNISKVNIKGIFEVEVEMTNTQSWAITLMKYVFGLLPVFYFAFSFYFFKGQSLGKKAYRLKVVSLYHENIGLWHAIERSLGYFASALEFGFGYVQAFWNPNRMALHDKIGETIVIQLDRKKPKFKFKMPKITFKKSAPLLLMAAICLSQTAQSIQKQDVELMTERGPIVLRLSDETPKHRDNFTKLVNLHQLDSLNFYRIIKTFLIQTGKDLPAEYPALIDAEFRPDLFHKRGALNAAREGDEYNPAQASAALHFTIIQGKVFNDSTLDKAEKRINHGIAYRKVITNPANAELFATMQKLNQAGANPFELKAAQAKLEELTQAELKTMVLYKIPEAHRQVYKTIGGAPHLDQNYTVFGEVVKGMDIVDSIAGVQTDATDKPLKDILILKARMIKRLKYK